jgi:nicotinate dehydrogenase subunit B
MNNSISRRDLLRTGGALVVSFSLGGVLPKRAAAQQAAAKPVDLSQVDSFLAIHPDSSITVYTSKVDVGTGLRIAMRQMVAEELGVPVDRIAMVEGDTLSTPDQGGTGGSTGITRGGVEIRQAAATARQTLIKLCSEQLKWPEDRLTIAGGIVRPVEIGDGLVAGIAIGTLVNGRLLSVKTDPQAPLKNPNQYTLVGEPLPRPDVPGKCTGRHTYVQDFKLSGMLHGRVIRPPAIGAKLQSVDEASIREIPDVRVVRIDNFLGVVAPDEWAAVRAARELKAIWSEWQGLPGNDGLERNIRQGPLDRDQELVKRGDPATALPAGAKQFSASYQWPYQSHGSLGPSCAIADVRPDGTTVWTSTQGTHGLRTSLSKIFAIPEDKLRVVYLDGAGSYGGNGNDDAAADAVLLSRAVGHPVRVQWMRHDEHGWDPKGPAQFLDLKGAIDAEGRIVSWETQMWLPTPTPGTRAFLGVDSAGLAQPHGQGAGQITQNGDPPYASSNVRVVVHWMKQSPLRISNLRAPGKIANTFAVESFVDEFATAAGVDAVEYRLRGLSDPRAIEVIKAAAQMIGWQSRPSPNPQLAQGSLALGRGFAYVRYKQAENYIAMAMEVAVDRTTGKVSVRRVTCAHDCGLVINADSLRNQIEGSILQTLSRALHEEVKFDRSHVTSIDWASYPILTFPEVPPIEVALIDRPELPPLGAGEASTAPVAAALANAIFDAAGVRLRTVPFTAPLVKAALLRS